MSDDARNLPADELRKTMRRWVTGVSIVASQLDDFRHGMTVNSFVSISLDPPLVTVTLAHGTRTHDLVTGSGHFGVTILEQRQAHLAEVFAGKVPDGGDRFAGVATFTLDSGVPLLEGGLAGLDCQVVHTYDMEHSTLFIGRVQAVRVAEGGEPLVYYNRDWHNLARM